MVKEIDLLEGVEEYLSASDPIQQDEKELVVNIVKFLSKRWGNRGLDFVEIFDAHSEKTFQAKGAIVAVVELLRTVASGETIPKEWKGLLQ